MLEFVLAGVKDRQRQIEDVTKVTDQIITEFRQVKNLKPFSVAKDIRALCTFLDLVLQGD